LRALIVTSEFPPGPGGIGTHAWELTRHLARSGWSVEVLARQGYRTGEEIDRFNKEQSFPVHRLSSTRLVAFRVLRKRLEQFHPDVALASGRPALWLLSTTTGTPTRAAVVHGSELDSGSLLARRFTKSALQRMTPVICVSRHTQERMKRLGIEAERSVVIPNGADASTFTPLSRQDIERARDDLGLKRGPVLLTVGHLSPRKGQEIVIRSLPRVLEAQPGTQYLMAGLPSEQTRLTDLAEELGVADHIRILGRVPRSQLNTLFNICDVFVLPSRTDQGEFEGFGITVVEAALAGKPAVVTEGTGLTEAIVDGQTGIAVPQNDVDSTARALVHLLTATSRRREMSAAARRRALREQTWEMRIAEYDRVLREAAADR
jgi:phosphatidylinositol alpha-1,6-mannosyltransferase